MNESDKYEQKREEQRTEQLLEGFKAMREMADTMVASGFTRKEAREFIFGLILTSIRNGGK